MPTLFSLYFDEYTEESLDESVVQEELREEYKKHKNMIPYCPIRYISEEGVYILPSFFNKKNLVVCHDSSQVADEFAN